MILDGLTGWLWMVTRPDWQACMALLRDANKRANHRNLSILRPSSSSMTSLGLCLSPELPMPGSEAKNPHTLRGVGD